MRWFRLYTDILDDPKCNVSNMLPETFRVFVLLMAYASELDSEGVIHKTDDPAWRLRISPAELSGHLETLENLGIISLENSDITFTNWKKRQFESDNSTARVKRYRNGKRNVSVTPEETAPDTESDTESDTETEGKEEPPTPAKPAKPVKEYPQEVHTLCKILSDLIQSRDPDFKPKAPATWLADMDRLIRIDNRPAAEIEQVIRFAQVDQFWHKNILSPDKLRAQYTRLRLEMQAKAKNGGNGKNGSRFESNMTAVRTVLAGAADQGEDHGGTGHRREIAGDDGDRPTGQDDNDGIHRDLPGSDEGDPEPGVF